MIIISSEGFFNWNLLDHDCSEVDIVRVVKCLVSREVDVVSIGSRHLADLRWPWWRINLGCLVDYWGFWHDEDVIAFRLMAKINLILTRREQISWLLDSNGLWS